MTDSFDQHISVLLQESIDALAIKPNGRYVDATFGRGGHSRLILSHLGEQGQLLSIDRDPTAQAEAATIDDPRFHFYRGPFSEIAQAVEQQDWQGQVDGVLFDLGVSSPQLDDPSRGFSFMKNGPLDMRMDPDSGMSAAQWLAEVSESDLAWVLKTYGEERFAKRIARGIVAAREEEQLTTTAQLAKLIAEISPTREKHKHAATRSFQAIRIYVNSELEEIKTALHGAMDSLAPHGRLAVISFHSLEDRLVKQFIKKQSSLPPVPKGLPLTEAQLHQYRPLKALSRAIKPTNNEIEHNVRARSSVLRIAEKQPEDTVA